MFLLSVLASIISSRDASVSSTFCNSPPTSSAFYGYITLGY
nr:MAG TPA: hypothetical protein [Caudoviricetes sp.]